MLRSAVWSAAAVVVVVASTVVAGFVFSDGEGPRSSAVQGPTPDLAPTTAPTSAETTSPIATTAPPTTTPPSIAYVPTVPPALAELTVPANAAGADALPGQDGAVQAAPNEGQQLGSIDIPKLGLVSYLFEGVQLTTLDLGPGHWPGTPMPGADGNVVLAGHRTSMNAAFANLHQLEEGDQVFLQTNDGTFTYAVTTTEIVDPSALWIADQTEEPTATLFACHPPGSVSQRIVVRLELDA